MFTFVAHPSFVREIKFVQPDGIKGAFTVKFLFKTADEVQGIISKELTDAYLKEVGDAENPIPLSIRTGAVTAKARNFWEVVIAGWEGIDLEFTPENLRLVVTRPWVISALQLAYNATPEKN